MNLYFLINNFHFSFELLGAVVFLMAAWLELDAFAARKDGPVLLRAIGLALFSQWQVVHALSVTSDVILYVSFFLFLLGLLFILSSFLMTKRLQMAAVVVIPAFSTNSMVLEAASVALLVLIVGAAFWQYRKELNKTWIPFSISFLFIAIGCGIEMISGGDDIRFIAAHGIKLIGFCILFYWVWQFLQLRVRESLALIFISASLFLGATVTLAFSTILVSRISSETSANLLTDAKVLDMVIKGLEEESLAKTQVIASDPQISDALSKNDFTALQTLMETYLESRNLGFITIVDAQGAVVIRAHALTRHGDTLAGERSADEALQGQSFVTVENSPVEKLSIRAGAPIYGKVGKEVKEIGAVIAGFPLDNALVDRMKRVTGLEMFVYDGNKSVAATALAADGRTRLTGITLNDASIKDAVERGNAVTGQTQLYGQPYMESFLPLKNGDDKVIGMIAAGKPSQDILDIANATNRLTLITVILIMAVLALPTLYLTRRLGELA